MKTDWKSGFSLPQETYVSASQWQRDVDIFGDTQWLLIDHESRIPKSGDWFVTHWGEESVIIVRGKDGSVRAFYNVCRHRGSRICTSEAGHARSFVCPYHAWTYNLDGSLRGAPLMSKDFDRGSASLKPVAAKIFHGLIFLNFAKSERPSFDAFTQRHAPFIKDHGLGSTKVVHREIIKTYANWKLAVENFYECYHCKPSHPTYCKVHDGLKLLALGAGPGSSDQDLFDRYKPVLEAWETKTKAMGHVTGMWADAPDSPWMQSASRLPIAEGAVTESLDGTAVAPLMGSLKAYDGGQTALVFNVFSTVLINNDHAVCFKFTPRGPLETDVEAIWLVDEKADLSPDAIDRVTEVWRVTALEDKTITEDNQKGVLSRAYEPGQLSSQESRIADFGAWYHRIVSADDSIPAIL